MTADLKLPWRAVFPLKSTGYWHIDAANGTTIATMWGPRAGQQAQIAALAVNAHTALVTAMLDILGHCVERGNVTDDHLFRCIEDDARAALVKARKEVQP